MCSIDPDQYALPRLLKGKGSIKQSNGQSIRMLLCMECRDFCILTIKILSSYTCDNIYYHIDDIFLKCFLVILKHFSIAPTYMVLSVAHPYTVLSVVPTYTSLQKKMYLKCTLCTKSTFYVSQVHLSTPM